MLKPKDSTFHPTAVNFHSMLEKARQHAMECIQASAEYNKTRWDKTHKQPDFKVGDQVLISTAFFTNLQGPRKLRDPFIGPFVIKALHGENAVEVIPTGAIARKHPTFPVSLLKKYESSDATKFPTRDEVMQQDLPVEEEPVGTIKSVIQEKLVRLNGKDTRFFLARFKGKHADEDKWLEQKDIPQATTLLRKFRASKRK
jgi:hypothetical protein